VRRILSGQSEGPDAVESPPAHRENGVHDAPLPPHPGYAQSDECGAREL